MDDLISRQGAIEALQEHRNLFCDNTPETFSKLSYAEKSRVDELDMAIATLINLPSAQPELIEKTAYIRGFEQGRTQGIIDTKAEKVAQPEIIRCKDCIFHGLCRTSPKWAVAPKDDWFCADAERRTDDETNKGSSY